MLVKSVVSLVFAFALVTCLDFLDDTNPYFEQYLTIIRAYGDLSQCNKSQCVLPCPGAAPPPRCPELVSDCLSGCACALDCEHATTTCFETQHCLENRVYLVGKKRKRPTTDESFQ